MKVFRMQSVVLGLVVSISLFAQAGHHQNNGGGNQSTGNGGSSVGQPTPNQPSAPAGNGTCLDHGKNLPIDNEQALQWKSQQSSGFHSRAFVSGTVDEVFADQTGHRHFSVKIGPNPDDHIEVIYNESFGQMPLPTHGEAAEACGDYIVATHSNGGYPPSPDGALVHWVHRSPNGNHDSGFVILNGVTYGGN